MLDYTDLIGTKFVNRGRNVKEGLDCYGLVMEVYKRYDITIPEYNADFNDSRKISGIIKQEAKKSCWQRADATDLPVPCIVAIRFGVPKGIVNHTGVYIGNGKFIHTRENIGVCVDRINSLAWSRCIEGFYKYVEE